MENLTGGTPPVRYLPCVVPCKLYFKSGDVSLSDISGKHSIYMMELSAISEHLSELGLVNVFGQGRLKASLTDAGQKLLQK